MWWELPTKSSQFTGRRCSAPYVTQPCLYTVSERMASSIQNVLSSGRAYYSLRCTLWKGIHLLTHKRLFYACTLSPVNWSFDSLLVRWWVCDVMFSVDHHVICERLNTWTFHSSMAFFNPKPSLRLWKLIYASNPQMYGPLLPAKALRMTKKKNRSELISVHLRGLICRPQQHILSLTNNPF